MLKNTKESQKKNLKILLSKKKSLKADECGDNMVLELSDKQSVLKDEQVLMQTIRTSVGVLLSVKIRKMEENINTIMLNQVTCNCENVSNSSLTI